MASNISSNVPQQTSGGGEKQKTIETKEIYSVDEVQEFLVDAQSRLDLTLCELAIAEKACCETGCSDESAENVKRHKKNLKFIEFKIKTCKEALELMLSGIYKYKITRYGEIPPGMFVKILL